MYPTTSPPAGRCGRNWEAPQPSHTWIVDTTAMAALSQDLGAGRAHVPP